MKVWKQQIFVDIDGTICSIKEDHNYLEAKPFPDRIKEINRLYDNGHIITYWTGRGGSTGFDWKNNTIMQLEDWGAKYHNLIVGDKPHFDLYICDKSVNSESYFNQQKFHITHTSFKEADEDFGFHL
jgi:hypothetical protein|tara:strand:- start:246 stop:626 length:381 start_codon:yes stop_codon:yes gene_type:complete